MGNQTPKEQPQKMNPVELQTHVMVVQTKLNLNRNKKVELIKRKRKEIAACLEDNSLDIAKAKMDSIIKEEDYITVFDILGPLCEILKEKISYLLFAEKCPDDLRATLDTIIYASTRLEIEELHKIRGIVKSKYGELYITKANSNADSLVNVNVVEKLKIKQAADPYIVARLKQLVKEDNVQYEFPQEVIPVLGPGGSHLTFETSPENFGFSNFNGNFQSPNFNNNFNDVGNMNNFNNFNMNMNNLNNMNYPNMNNNIGINNFGGGNNMNLGGNSQYNLNNINMNNMKNMNQMNMNNISQMNQMNQMNMNNVSQMSQINQMHMNQNNISQINMNNSNIRNQNPNVNLSQGPGNFNLPNIQNIHNSQNIQNIQNNQSQNMGVNVNQNNNYNQNSGLPTQSIVLNPSNIYMNNNNQMDLSNFNQANYNMTPGNNSVIHSKNGINENSVNFNLIDRSVNYQGNESVNPYLGDFNRNSGFNKLDVSQQSTSQRLYTNNSINNQITPGGFNDINAPSVIDSHNYEINVKQNSYVAGDMGFPKAKSDPNNDDIMSLFPKSNKSKLDDFPKSKGDI